MPRSGTKKANPAPSIRQLSPSMQFRTQIKSENIAVTTITLSKSTAPICLEKLLNMMQEHHNEQAQPLHFFQDSKRLRSLFALASYPQQIQYLSLTAASEKTLKHPKYRQALAFAAFTQSVHRKTGIVNAALYTPQAYNIIYAVHPSYLEDPEILAGLTIPYKKSDIIEGKQPNIAYVCDPRSLALAIANCQINSTLVIDGHWEHKQESTHGVWENISAEKLATHLSSMLHKHPNKVNYIRLLGCHSGALCQPDQAPTNFQPKSLLFKSDLVPGFSEKPMAEFRDRAIYYGNTKNHPFARDSLAGMILYHAATPIMLTAPPSLTYPYPSRRPSDTQFNIGSDNERWREEHYWEYQEEATPDWQKRLSRLKSTTLIPQAPHPQTTKSWPAKSSRFFYRPATPSPIHSPTKNESKRITKKVSF